MSGGKGGLGLGPGRGGGSLDLSGKGGLGFGTPPAQSSGGGGVFGWLGSKLALAGRDIEGIPGGAYHIVKDVLPGTQDLLHPIRWADTYANTVKGMVGMTAESIRHPGRDPFQTALNVAPAIGGIGRIGEASLAAKAAEGGLAEKLAAGSAKLTEHGGQPYRTLTVGENQTPVTLLGSRNAGVRLLQAGYDRMLQKALDREAAGQPLGRVGSRIAEHGMKRVGGALAEQQRIAQKMRAVPASLLDRAAMRLSKLPGKSGDRFHQAALELTSVQTPAEEAAAYHYAQAAKGVNPDVNALAGKLYEQVAKRGLVHVDETRPAGAKVFINPAHAALAKADEKLAAVQQRGDTLLAQHDVMTPAQLEARASAPARIRAGAHYEEPTPGKLGIESPALKAARAYEATVGRNADRAVAKFGSDSPQASRLRAAQSVAAERVQKLEESAARRVKPTGIVGGETARPGRGYIGEGFSEKKLAKTEHARSQGPVHGVAQSPISKKPYTGRNLELGLRPADVTGGASRHFRQILRFENTDKLRRAALETSSPFRRSNRDVLLAIPDEKQGLIPAAIREAFGQQTRAVDHPNELAKILEDQASAEGLRAALQMRLNSWLDKVDSSKRETVGSESKAPPGYRWVDENMIRALQDESRSRGGNWAKLGRVVDNVNSAVTALTVYFKVGHVGTRVFTNAATNLIQGSLDPLTIARSYKLWDALPESDKARALAAAGQHGFSALPHEGTSIISRTAGRGAQFWARHADAPFRFNALADELHKAGYSTPDKFKAALDALENNGHGLPAHEWSKISAAARRADREAISYDRLTSGEKQFLTRGIWFYPWIKGSTLFTLRSILEHPVKMAVAGNLGVQGREQQLKLLGETPSYEAGLVPLGGGPNPLTTDLSTFSPFSTAGQLAFVPGQPSDIAGLFNPALGAASQLAYGLNQYGAPSKTPYQDALLALFAATPEQQIAESIANQGQDQSNRMFPKTPWSTIERFLIGPALPRRVNPSALAKAAARERSGQR